MILNLDLILLTFIYANNIKISKKELLNNKIK